MEFSNKGYYTKKPPEKVAFILLRRKESNQRPSGYEPDELPLLYSAIYIFLSKSPAKVLLFFYLTKYFRIFMHFFLAYMQFL